VGTVVLRELELPTPLRHGEALGIGAEPGKALGAGIADPQ
jgi:hypothetical protein